MFDVDDFKIVNDKFGHTIGDECLIKFGEIFLKHQELTVYRYGGEEFLAVCDSLTENEFCQVIKNILLEVNNLKISEKDVRLTVSAGYTFCIPKKNESDENLINKADHALYIAKKNGKNRFEKAID